MEKKQVHILYTVLDWGLGHATRSIPIIEYLLESGVKISIAGEGDSLFLLKNNFPHLNFYLLNGIQVKYSAKGFLVLKMALSVPKNLKVIYEEQQQIKKLINKIRPDAVISDNRFGAWSNIIPSLFITHQLNIIAPKKLQWLEPILYRFNKFFLKKYTKVWIPDFANEINLSGKLSHNPKSLQQINHEFIGPISRFTNCKNIKINESYDLLIILSGPEPQRSIFEKKCIDQSLALNLRTLLVRGKPQETLNYSDHNLKVVSHLNSDELKTLIINTAFIVCRAGYSTIMDLSSIKKSALCIATPGQTEQEYLVDYLMENKFLVSQQQSLFNLKLGIAKLSECKPMPSTNHSLMKFEVDRFLNDLKKF